MPSSRFRVKSWMGASASAASISETIAHLYALDIERRVRGQNGFTQMPVGQHGRGPAGQRRIGRFGPDLLHQDRGAELADSL